PTFPSLSLTARGPTSQPRSPVRWPRPPLSAPVVAQVRDQVLGALLGEEDLCPVDLDDLVCPRDQVAQVIRPLDGEIRVRGAPDQQGRCLECAQLVPGGLDVGRVERGEQPLAVTSALDGPGGSGE